MLAFFAFSGITFWIIIGITLLSCVYVIERDEETHLGLPLGIIAVVAAIFAFANWQTVKHFQIDWKIFWIATGLYLLAGIIWSFFKWYLLVSKAYKKYLEKVKENEESEKRFQKKKEEAQLAGKRYDYEPLIIMKEQYKPDVTENKEQISAWILFWPISGLRYLIGNALVDFLNGIVNMFKTWYNSITNSQFGKHEKTSV